MNKEDILTRAEKFFENMLHHEKYGRIKFKSDSEVEEFLSIYGDIIKNKRQLCRGCGSTIREASISILNFYRNNTNKVEVKKDTKDIEHLLEEIKPSNRPRKPKKGVKNG